MTLVGNPIPTLPEWPHANGAPPGFTVDFEAFRAWNGDTLDPTRRWCDTRPTIVPQVIVVHTNAAEQEGSTGSKERWGNRRPSNTKAHYNVNNPTPKKHVPSNLRAIANSTGSDAEAKYGVRDSSYWALAIETADKGTKNSPQAPDGSGIALDFVSEWHAELVARAIAYEALAHNLPIEVPQEFHKNMRGVVAHTEPFPYPFFTTRPGKTCPTFPKKERVLRGDILPRANELAWWWHAQFNPIAEPEPQPEPQPEPEPTPIEDEPLEAADMFILSWQEGVHPGWTALLWTGSTIAHLKGNAWTTFKDRIEIVPVDDATLLELIKLSDPTTPPPDTLTDELRFAWTA